MAPNCSKRSSLLPASNCCQPIYPTLCLEWCFDLAGTQSSCVCRRETVGQLPSPATNLCFNTDAKMHQLTYRQTLFTGETKGLGNKLHACCWHIFKFTLLQLILLHTAELSILLFQAILKEPAQGWTQEIQLEGGESFWRCGPSGSPGRKHPCCWECER